MTIKTFAIKLFTQVKKQSICSQNVGSFLYAGSFLFVAFCGIAGLNFSAQAAPPSPAPSLTVRVQTDAWHAIISASPVVQLTLFILVILSVMCWAVIFSKSSQLKKNKYQNTLFVNRFWKANSLEVIYNEIKQFSDSPVAHVFQSGYTELQKIADSPLVKHTHPKESPHPPRLMGIDNMERALTKSMDHEIAIMESRLNLLATTGSTGPFIGLFGTVWGIMSSFAHIGQTGSASLAVVAPGISEALIATAIGLAAAIPAVVAYNHFISQIKRQEVELRNFSLDFLNIVKRNFFKGDE